jgi:hypothetical protein
MSVRGAERAPFPGRGVLGRVPAIGPPGKPALRAAPRPCRIASDARKVPGLVARPREPGIAGWSGSDWVPPAVRGLWPQRYAAALADRLARGARRGLPSSLAGAPSPAGPPGGRILGAVRPGRGACGEYGGMDLPEGWVLPWP